jgi:alpha-L-fucosidase
MVKPATALDSAGPRPTAAQRNWQEMELSAFVHFGPDTFTNWEWSEGKEDPTLFQPTDNDCDHLGRGFQETGF